MAEKLRLFSADRRGLYGEGPLTLMQSPPYERQKFNPLPGFTESDIIQHVLAIFPDGLSIHGWDYATQINWLRLQGGGTVLKHNPAIELVFEYVRRAYFPDRPSRLQSFFAFDDQALVSAFSDKPMYEMFPQYHFKCDMAWLNVADQLMVASYRAHQYWNGAPSPKPEWEYLLVPPVEIMRVPA